MRAIRTLGRALPLIALAALLGASAAAEGSETHLAMGWVTAVSAEQLQLRGKDGKVLSFLLTAETEYRRDPSVARREDIRVGERAVVRYDEAAAGNPAIEVRLEVAAPVRAPTSHDHHGPVAEPPHPETQSPLHEHGATEHGEMAMPMHAGGGMEMDGRLGPYPAQREASGTSWQPDSTPHRGLHRMGGPWTLMAHGFVDLVWDDQGGRRGDEELFSGNMAMVMAQRPAGPGTLGLRGMVSLDPATVGEEGYPLLLQTGETADGKTPLIDRQHPHDFLMELAASYSVPLRDRGSVFGYLAFPGEPALGPPVFMHRFSGEEIPAAPISHHWLDSTHITFGVATLGAVWAEFKLEGSVFTGREPDEERWGFDEPKFDSYSMRLSWNPTPDWALQTSWGSIHSPEELESDVDTDRATASVSFNHHASPETLGQTTFAWGRNRNDPGKTLDALLLESTVALRERHIFFGRLEHAEKDELFEHEEPLAGRVFDVSTATLGYRYDWSPGTLFSLGVGGLVTAYDLPQDLEPAYGSNPTSYMLFSRVRLR